jgi:polyphosphate glucokinase
VVDHVGGQCRAGGGCEPVSITVIDAIYRHRVGDRPTDGERARRRASYPARMADGRTDGGAKAPRHRELPWDPNADPGADPILPQPTARLSGPALGIDVGGTGVKAALVDLATAELLSARVREKTPQPSTPEAVAETIARVVANVLDTVEAPEVLPVGCGLPGIVKAGRLASAANIDPGWVGWPATDNISAAVGRPVLIVNDADAAGLAELAFGAARGRSGTIILLTLGTGIGSAVFIDGRLVPNTELGHLEFHGQDAEYLVSGAARERRKLGWKAWMRQFNLYLARLELYLSPDLIILGGGVSKEYARWGKFVKTRCEVLSATFLNTSGIIGAAYAAGAQMRGSTSAPTDIPIGETPEGAEVVVPQEA